MFGPLWSHTGEMKKFQTTPHKNSETKWKCYQKTAQCQHIPSTFSPSKCEIDRNWT